MIEDRDETPRRLGGPATRLRLHNREDRVSATGGQLDASPSASTVESDSRRNRGEAHVMGRGRWAVAGPEERAIRQTGGKPSKRIHERFDGLLRSSRDQGGRMRAGWRAA